MRILIDTTYAQRAARSGTGVYLAGLCAALRECPQVELVEVFNRVRRPPAGGGRGSIRNLLVDERWAHIDLPRLARRERAQVIHHALPAHAWRCRIPQVVTLHDLAFERLPECFDPRFRLYAHLSHRRAARRAAAVVCVSQTTAADARELWSIPSERLVVARLGPGQELGPGPQARAASSPGRHFIYVGDDEPRKNLATLLAAYRVYRERSDSPLPLVLAGSASGAGEGIVSERAPDAPRLEELLSGAVALVQPSLYEGFGMTALEAMSAGVPVLAARSPGVVEVCAQAALYVEPRDVPGFADALGRLADEPGLREELTRLGRAQAAQFSWSACARAHLAAYRLALDLLRS